MHYVIVRPTGADCSCGYEISAMTGAQAATKGEPEVGDEAKE